jgi:hypothetical protein
MPTIQTNFKTFQEVNFAMGESLKRHHAKNTKYS